MHASMYISLTVTGERERECWKEKGRVAPESRDSGIRSGIEHMPMPRCHRYVTIICLSHTHINRHAVKQFGGREI